MLIDTPLSISCSRHIVQAHPGPRLTCGDTNAACTGVTFGIEKDLLRHLQGAKHRDFRYTCGCGTSKARKDEHRNHLRNCKDPEMVSFYLCACGHRTHSRAKHEDHISECGQKRRGRPPGR